MATRRSDVGISRSSSVPRTAPVESDRRSGSNRITTRSVQPLEPSRDPLVDPSPFSRPAAPEAASREERIARAAYCRAEKRGFAPGGEVEDWLSAEREIDGGMT